MVRRIHAESNGSAGARTIEQISSDRKLPISRYRAGKMMKQLRLQSCQLPKHNYKKALQEHIGNYILGYYSQVRPHQFNGGKTPNKAEQIYWLNCSNDVAKFT
ncbi:hypothetical protein [Thiomicrorhabdus lithotrophica]|jgi:putative transposase|uniref:hypothetical protein n=1 Tax=Thiomicrorhabdus lithotrophica TaxID=2949997 RepID=UPI0037DDDA4D